MDTEATQRASSPAEYHDPLLSKLLETATFDCDWETLRHHLYLALLAALPVFVELGQPAPYERPPAASLSPTASRDPAAAGQGQDSGRSTPLSDGSSDHDHVDESLRPSTPGGLVIPPFPPLDPKRRRPTVTVITANPETRLNGTPQMPRGNPFEEEYDEEVIIGGRKLPGWMDEEDGKKEVEKIAQKLEELTFPPFTLQRLTELLTAPTRLHKSLGKFLRAVDKMLVVTTAHAPPSYTYVPPPNQLPVEEFPSGSPRMSPASMDLDSTVPPGSMTPMFSPIPFLARDDGLGEPMDTRDGLMSPLLLTQEVFTSQQSGERSPTPEPEDDGERPATSPGSSGTEAATGDVVEAVATTEAAQSSSAPGNQPYLGRVDELDSGPITSNGHHEAEEGVGETGSMTPHGMSERPVALSSTTVIGEDEREIAPLPRRGEESPSSEDRDTTASE